MPTRARLVLSGVLARLSALWACMTSPSSDRAVARWRGLRVGPLLMILAGLSFTLMVSLVKVSRAELSVMEVVFWRGAVAMPLIVVLAGRRSWRSRQPGLLLLRSTLGLCAMFLYFYAAKGLAVTDQTLLGKLQPLVIAALAPLFLGARERTGWFGWSLIFTGLVGSAILIAPELRIGSLFGLAALGATVFSALGHLCIRQLTSTDAPFIIVLWFQGFVTVISGLYLAFTATLALPDPHLWLPLAGVGLLAVTGQVLMTYAYRADQASVVATAAYTTPLWAVGVDLVFWEALPGWNSWLGGVIVVGAGLLLVASKR